MSNEPTPLVFNPTTGLKMETRVTAESFRRESPGEVWYRNPWTGETRSGADRRLDPTGLGICDPGHVAAPDNPTQHVKDMLREMPSVACQQFGEQTVLAGARGQELLAAELTLVKMGYHYEGGEMWKPPLGNPPAFSAPDLLAAAEKHMRDRAATYDKPEGERSMGKTVQAFNAVTGRDLRESEGWLLLALLKMVRSETRETPHRDSVEDLIAYGGLYGEARLGGN